MGVEEAGLLPGWGVDGRDVECLVRVRQPLSRMERADHEGRRRRRSRGHETVPLQVALEDHTDVGSAVHDGCV